MEATKKLNKDRKQLNGKEGVAHVKGSQTSPLANFMHFLEDKLITQNVIEPTFKKYLLDILLIDFVKAFDYVPHHMLLLKLSSYSITGKVLKRFVAFLKDRRQRNVLGNQISAWSQIKFHKEFHKEM